MKDTMFQLRRMGFLLVALLMIAFVGGVLLVAKVFAAIETVRVAQGAGMLWAACLWASDR